MEDRIQEELELLRKSYPDLEYVAEGRWVRIPAYPLPEGWNRSSIDVAIQIPDVYPAGPPYGIYTPAGLKFKDQGPKNYVEPSPKQPPFNGTWGIFSWTTEDDKWIASDNVVSGRNLRNWIMGFRERFEQGI